jgi:hypothetical protein
MSELIPGKLMQLASRGLVIVAAAILSGEASLGQSVRSDLISRSELSLSECLDSISVADWADPRTARLVNDLSEGVSEAEQKLPAYFLSMLKQTLAVRFGALVNVGDNSYITPEYHKVMTERELARFAGELVMVDYDNISESAARANVTRLDALFNRFTEAIGGDPVLVTLPEESRKKLLSTISEPFESIATDFFSPGKYRAASDQEIDRIKTILEQSHRRFQEVARADVVQAEKGRQSVSQAFMIGVETNAQLRRAFEAMDRADGDSLGDETRPADDPNDANVPDEVARGIAARGSGRELGSRTRKAAARYEAWEEDRKDLFKAIEKDLKVAEKIEADASGIEKLMAAIDEEEKLREAVTEKQVAAINAKWPGNQEPIRSRPRKSKTSAPSDETAAGMSRKVLLVTNLVVIGVLTTLLFIRHRRSRRSR